MKKIVICGGHLTPAQALIEQLAKQKDTKIYFLGRKYVTEGSSNLSAEFKQISNLDVEFKNIIAGRIQRRLTARTIFSLAKIPISFIQCFFLLILIRPQLIVSFGGSISFPTIFDAWLLGIDSITHEQAVVPGLANRLNGLFVKKIYVSWQKTTKYFPREKTEVIGNLVRSSLQKHAKSIPIKKKSIFVTGGNQGSHFLNTLIFENIEKLRGYTIIHQIGTANFKEDHKKAKSVKQAGYKSYDYISPHDLSNILQESEIVISRAGANTIWEIALFGKVAILVPLPGSASSEQQENAQILESAGSGIVLDQKNLSFEKLLETVHTIEKNYESMRNQAQKLAKSIPTDADEKLAEEVRKG